MSKINQLKFKRYIFRYEVQDIPNPLPWLPSFRTWGRTLREAKVIAKRSIQMTAALRTGEVKHVQLYHGARYHNPLSYKNAGSDITHAPTKFEARNNVDVSYHAAKAIRDRHFSELRHTR